MTTEDAVAAFMEYMAHANKEEIPHNIELALWELIGSGMLFRRYEDKHNPLNIVVNAAIRWKAEQCQRDQQRNK